jgi:hypothetical protein
MLEILFSLSLSSPCMKKTDKNEEKEVHWQVCYVYNIAYIINNKTDKVQRNDDLYKCYIFLICFYFQPI